MIKGLITFICLIPSWCIAQQIDNKYLHSIIYLQSNQDVIEIVNTVFQKGKSKKVWFHVSDKISFVDLEIFKDNIRSPNEEFEIEILEKRGAFREQYEFDSYPLISLKRLLPERENSLVLHFSKPFGNLLAAELTLKNMRANGRVRFGRSIILLFTFDDIGMIEDVSWKPLIHN